jgi:drug/metabolite transporter (DMT)-like permease
MVKQEKLLPVVIGGEEKNDLNEPMMIETIDGADQVQEEKHLRLWKRIPCLGLILVLLRVTMSLIRQAGIKELVGISPLVYQIYQTMFSLSMSIPWSVAVDKGPFPPNEPRKVNGLFILRGISSCLTTLSVVFALQNMSIGTYSMVLATRPFFSLILAKIFLSEPFGIPEIITMILLFSGIIFVVKPPFIFPQDLLEDANYGENFYLAVGLLLLGTIMAGNVQVILRHLRLVRFQFIC